MATNPLQYSCLKNPMDTGALGGGGPYCPWGRKELHTTENLMQCFLLMQEEEVTTHSSIVAWRIPGTEEPGGLQSLGVKKDSEPTE